MQVGEIDWNDADVSSGKSDFMKLEEGENTVRVMGNPIQFYIHWAENGKSKKKFNSPTTNPGLVRRLEDSGFKKQARWFVKVLDRKSESYKLLEIGPQVLNSITQLTKNKRWGKVTNYDLTITRAPKGTQPLYSVTPNPQEAIPDEIKSKYQDFNDRVNVDKFIAPSPVADIMEFMGWSADKAAKASAQKTPQKGDDYDFDFES